MTTPESNESYPHNTNVAGPTIEQAQLSDEHEIEFMLQTEDHEPVLGSAIEAFEASGELLTRYIVEQYNSSLTPDEARRLYKELRSHSAIHAQNFILIFNAILAENTVDGRAYDPDDIGKMLGEVFFEDLMSRDKACEKLSGTPLSGVEKSKVIEATQQYCRGIDDEQAENGVEEGDTIDLQNARALLHMSFHNVTQMEVTRLLAPSPQFEDYKGIDWKKKALKLGAEIGKVAAGAALATTVAIIATKASSPKTKKSPRRR